MIRLLLSLPLLLAAPSCSLVTVDPETGERVVDLERLHARLDKTADDARSWATYMRASGDEDAAESLERVAGAIEGLDQAVADAQAGEQVDLLGAADLALSALEAVAADEDEPRLALFVALARSILGEVRLALSG